MKVVITTAVEVETALKSSIEKTLLARFKDSKPSFVFVVDPTVLGGIKLTLGSKELDGTLRARLGQVEEQLTAHL